MNLQDKILKYFDGKVVRKDLTKRIKGYDHFLMLNLAISNLVEVGVEGSNFCARSKN